MLCIQNKIKVKSKNNLQLKLQSFHVHWCRFGNLVHRLRLLDKATTVQVGIPFGEDTFV